MTGPLEFFEEVAAEHPRCFWLDGGGARAWSGRRSIIGWLDDDDVSLTFDASGRSVIRHVAGTATVVGDDIFEVLEEEMVAGDPVDQWFGYFGYACRTDLPTLAPAAAGPTEAPDAVWMRARRVRMFEHAAEDGTEGAEGLAAVAAQPARPPSSAARPTDVAVPDDYAGAFARVQEHLYAGNSYEVNLTYRVEIASDLAPSAAYLRLRELNPAPYAGFLQHDVPGHEAWLLSSSPERYALVTADRTLETKPIKGTTPRGETPDDDAVLRLRLASEPKFRAENLMIVDLLRNDLSMVCDPGSVGVPVLMEVESYASVHQLVSTVRGVLADGVTTVGALRTLFPAGSMTGAPKLRTMEIIAEVEDTARGAYSGAFGWIAADGRADLGVIIRSLTTTGDRRYVLGTGGGITVHSDVAEEYAESRWKAERLRQVFDG